MKAIEIIYEDDEIILINKEAGFAVQGGKGIVHSVDTVLPVQLGYPVHLLHRLDKDTAGILALAKNPQAAAHLTNLIASGRVQKQYTAFCFGAPNPKDGTINEKIYHKNESKDAFTAYKTTHIFRYINQETEPINGISRIEVKLGTGRMHQIRIHLAKIGCPIIADDKYGHFKQNKAARKCLNVKTLQLAATRLELPIQGHMQSFEIFLPSHMINLYDYIEKYLT